MTSLCASLDLILRVHFVFSGFGSQDEGPGWSQPPLVTDTKLSLGPWRDAGPVYASVTVFLVLQRCSFGQGGLPLLSIARTDLAYLRLCTFLMGVLRLQR